MPIIPLDNAFITSPADVPGPRKVDLQDADITPGTRSTFDTLCEKYPKVFLMGMRTLVEHNWLRWTLIRETALRSAPDRTLWC